MKRLHPLVYSIAGMYLMTLLACSTTSTKVTSAWKAQDATTRVQNVLILGVANKQSTRTLFESSFAGELGAHGVTAYPSYSLFTSTGIPDRAAIDEVIKSRNIDTVLITRLVDRKDIQQYVPGTQYSATDPFYGDWYGYYGSIYNYSPGYYSPGHVVQKTLVVLQTNLYDAAKNSLVWSATSDTTTQDDRAEVIRSFISSMIKKMQKDGLIR